MSLLCGWSLVGCGDGESTATRPQLVAAAGPCVSPPGAYSTSDTPRQLLPWSLVPAEASAGDGNAGDPSDAAAGAGSGGAATRSGCQTSIQFGVDTSTVCHGTAQVHAGGAGPTLTLDDGSSFTWDSTRIHTEAPLRLELALDSVWVTYSESKTQVCPFCGSYTAQAITVREHENGKLLLVAQQGHRISDVSGSPLLLELFGVDGVARAYCSYSASAGCYTYDRTEFDHAVLTEPEQLIPGATLTRVSSDNGDYDVLWVHSETANLQRKPLCNDGPIDASDTGFLAIRRD